MKQKTFIASGCSFTFEDWCWPTPVAEHYDMNLINVGMGSQDNALISKKAIYQVDKLLKEGTNPDDIFVGIMWSGIDRYSFFTEDTTQRVNTNGWLQNPTAINGNLENAHWIILNGHWETREAKSFYGNISTTPGMIIRTIQHILFTQWYLEKNNIKYFMTTFMNILNQHPGWLNHFDIRYLYDMIDQSKFIDVIGEYEWVASQCNGEFFCTDKFHPNATGHSLFAKEIIIPFIDETYGKIL